MNKKQLSTLIMIIMIILTGCEKPSNSINTKESNASCSEEPSSFVGNPAAFYCTNVMGYEYQVITEEDGSQKGQCSMPDGLACDQWAFYAGECGAEYSYCALEEMSIETRHDGNDPYSSTYGVCTGSGERSEFKISDIIDFNLKPSEKVPSEKGTRTGDLPALSDNIRDTLPTHFDWRDVDGQDWMTPVKNQGVCGSCWAFSGVGAMEPYYNFINNDPNLDLDLSEENLVSDCFYTGCSGGWTEDALIYARDVGIVDETCMPYTATDSECASMCVDPEKYTVDQIVWDYYTLDVDTLKYLVVNYGPVSVSLKMSGYWNGDIYECDALEEWDTNHAVVVVGYDEPGQYWIVKNSWGTDWFEGEEGYFKVGFNQCNINTTFYAYLPTNFVKTYLPFLTTSGTPFTIKPNLTSPSEGQIINTLKPRITWEIDNSLHEATFIIYQISPDPNLHQFSGGVFNSDWAQFGESELQGNLKEGTTYYMHAAYDYLNDSDYWVIGPYSEPITFTTGTGFDVPGKTLLVSPSDGTVLDDTNVTLTWEPITSAGYYQVYLLWEEYLEHYGYITVGWIYNTNSTIFNISQSVMPNTTYTWYVRAANDTAWGEYSDMWTFTTGGQASGSTRAGEQINLEELFIMDKDGKMIPYEVFIRGNP